MEINIDFHINMYSIIKNKAEGLIFNDVIVPYLHNQSVDRITVFL